MFRCLQCAVALAATGLTVHLQAAPVVLPLTPSSQDRIVLQADSGASPNTAGYHVGIGGSLIGTGGTVGANHSQSQRVFGFILPNGVQTLTSATFTISNANPTSNQSTTALDLWGLATTNPDGSGTSLWYEGDGPNAPHTKLADDFLNTSSAAGATANLNVTTWINTFYTGEDPSQSEVFFRVNQEVATAFGTFRRMAIDSSSVMLTLEFEPVPPPAVVPEPGSIALWSAVGVMALTLHLRKRRLLRSA